MATRLIKNQASFEHQCRNGTMFSAVRCDFVGGVMARMRKGATLEQFAQDVAQLIGYHALTIRADLDGFVGYDAIEFEVERG
jgi:hypothetical protein